MNNIHLLEPVLINQIAAGEVIERPASVVKELIENALDANARSISVEIQGAGQTLIRVTDDGTGMSKQDLHLSLQRHATSKIASVDDLFDIKSLGFRGEALPSIASVSRVNLSSKQATAELGWSFDCEAGKIIGEKGMGMPEGTIIEVKDLFFNTPARRKFLKTIATEQRNIIDIVSRYALCFPECGFRLEANHRQIFNLERNETLVNRVGAVLGKGIGKTMQEFANKKPGINLYGLVAPPSITRPTRAGIYTFVNQRSLRDPTLISAVLEGCRGMFMKRKYPVAIIFINIDPKEIDINVHPSKAEVRFKNTSAIFGLIAGTLKKTFNPSSQSQPALHAGIPMSPDMHNPFDRNIKGEQTEIQQSINFNKSGNFNKSMNFNKSGNFNKSINFNKSGESMDLESPMNVSEPVQESAFSHPPMLYADKSIIGTLHSTYILLQDRQGLYILDQHAAHERVNYERLGDLKDLKKREIQILLHPIVMELGHTELKAFEEIEEKICALGIECQAFGEDAISIRTLPSILGSSDIREIIMELIHNQIMAKPVKTAYMDDIMATIACHRSIRAGDHISIAEITALLRALDSAGSPVTCPHGRPLFKEISIQDIERWVGRRP